MDLWSADSFGTCSAVVAISCYGEVGERWNAGILRFKEETLFQYFSIPSKCNEMLVLRLRGEAKAWNSPAMRDLQRARIITLSDGTRYNWSEELVPVFQ